MSKIKFVKDIESFEAKQDLTLRENLLDQGLPVASSCDGDGVCCKCLVKVEEGEENLKAISERESEMRIHFRIPKTYRVSCQVKVLGSIKVDTAYW